MGQFSTANPPNLHIFGLWEETRGPRGNPRRHGENLILFGLSNQLVASFKEENAITFKHLFLKGYQGPDENDGSFIIYTQQEVYSSMFYTINQ
eukprot:g32392.t1